MNRAYELYLKFLKAIWRFGRILPSFEIEDRINEISELFDELFKIILIKKTKI